MQPVRLRKMPPTGIFTAQHGDMQEGSPPSLSAFISPAAQKPLAFFLRLPEINLRLIGID
jgi:hypothetical protein